MKILALDIGAGTEDILLYDSRKKIENCIKMVLPSPTPILVNKSRIVSQKGRDLFVAGDTIGGGGLTRLLREHVKKGHNVYMMEEAAYTLYNDLDRVKSAGIRLADKPPQGFTGGRLNLKEVNISAIKQFLKDYSEPLTDLDGVAIAVQDHGVAPKGVSQNVFRLETFRKQLGISQDLRSLLFSEEEIPRYYVRMRSAARASRRDLPSVEVFVMDSVVAAIVGCLEDPAIKTANLIAINIGNSHTTAALIIQGKATGIMEHHTSLLTSTKFKNYLRKLEEGKLTNDDILNDGGHGAFYVSKPPDGATVQTIVVTGPRRTMINETGLEVHFAAPGGDVMMTGPIGLVKAVESRTEAR